MHGIPQYAVSIALAYRGEVVAGVIYDVAKNELFTAAKGEGAFLDNRRIRVSDRKDMNRAVIGTGFPFRRSDDFKGYMMSFMRVAERTAGIRRPGSAALDLAWVAAGRYDGFWESGLSKWDIAAGGLMVLEAGGLITDLSGGEDWLEQGRVCAGHAAHLRPAPAARGQVARRRRSPEGLIPRLHQQPDGPDRFVVRPFFITGSRIRALPSLKIP